VLILNEPERDLRDRFERGALSAVDVKAHPVVERWARVRALRALGALPSGSDAVGLRERVSRTSAVVARADDVLELVSTDLNRRGLAVLLADRDGVVLTSRGVDIFDDRAIRAGLGDGGRMSEAALGTNAVGTALAEETAVTVIGPAHYEPAAQRLCCYAAPIRDAMNQIVAVLDISGPREAADPLLGILVQSLAGMLESKLSPEPLRLVPVLETESTRDRFSAVLGHDLRNPLNAITMSARLLLQRGGLATPQARDVSRIQSSAARIQELVDGVLDYTRARFSMGFPIKPVPADMGEIVASTVDEIRAAHPERAIGYDVRGDTRGVWDPARVTQVVSNLVANAVEHGRDPLAVGVTGAGDAVIVSVSNRGAPISAAKMATLFEPFRRGDASKGIGLGLFIAREIVRSHGATIELASTHEETVFTTRWPRRPG
jgi:signal transduction histidine kinase